MPRQISPGGDHEAWIPRLLDEGKPPIHNPVFPELVVDDIPDEDWNNYDKLTEDQKERRFGRDHLNQLLYNGLMAMFQDRFSTISEKNWLEYADELIGNIREDVGFKDRLYLEGMIYRIARTQPMGFYVPKGRDD